MTLLAVGLNHQTASLSLREKLALSADRVPTLLRQMVTQGEAQEVVILSTCNRTEIYGHQVDLPHLVSSLARIPDYPSHEIESALYRHHNGHAVRHIMRVASGLDSMALGESQIFGQMKQAVALAQETGTLGSHLQHLFQRVYAATKEVRTETAIGENPISLTHTAVSMAKHIFNDFSKRTALLIGAGETIQLAARYLKDHGVQQLIIANRSVEKAYQLGKEWDAVTISLADIPAYLAKADIIISATGSDLPLLGKGAVERALKQRKRRPMYMVDLAVPRDIEPEVGNMPDVYLYNIDHLQSFVEEAKQKRQQAAKQAEDLIAMRVDTYLREIQALAAMDLVREFRQGMDAVKEKELVRAQQMLAKGQDPEQVLKALANSLTNKFTHQPSVALKEAGYTGDHQLLQMAKSLLGLPED